MNDSMGLCSRRAGPKSDVFMTGPLLGICALLLDIRPVPSPIVSWNVSSLG